MKFSFLLLAVASLSCGSAFAQTTSPNTTSTTSGPISGSGATTSGTVSGNVGPARYTSQAYRDAQRNDQATDPNRQRTSKNTKMKKTLPDGRKMKTKM